MKLWMKSKCCCVLVFLLFLLPGIVAAQNGSREYSGYRWYDGGIVFTYPFSIAEDAGSFFSPATADNPETVKIVFENYHAETGWMPTGAEIHIMLASTLPADLYEFADALSSLPDDVDAIIRHDLRFAELADGASISTAQARPLDFQSGSGLRFVTYVQQGADAASLAYRFAGKTTDSRYLVTAIFPISAVQANAETLDSMAEHDFTPDLALVDSVMASLAVAAPEASLLAAQTDGHIEYNGIQFAYDTSLAYRVEVTSVAPIVGEQAQQTMFGVTPGYVQFSFAGYPVTGNVQFPHLFVFPAAEFPGPDQLYGERLLALREFLTESPELSAGAGFERAQNPLPILPLQNAAQVLVAQPQYIRFGSGVGVRYITFYAQSFLPLNSADLFYVFTGMSDDGAYAVGAIFPLEAGFLPAGRTVYDIADLERFSMNYQTYVDGLLLQIDVMNTSAFLPRIELLDAMISSLTVAAP